MFGLKNEEILTCLLLIVVGYFIATMFSKRCNGFSVGILDSLNLDNIKNIKNIKTICKDYPDNIQNRFDSEGNYIWTDQHDNMCLNHMYCRPLECITNNEYPEGSGNMCGMTGEKFVDYTDYNTAVKNGKYILLDEEPKGGCN